MSLTDEEIADANARLKQGLSRVTILRRKDRLWLRGTLPPKPHLGKKRPHQQAISLGARAIATKDGLNFAFKKAQILTGQLVAGTFDWADWIDLEKVAPTASGLVRDWVAEYEREHWAKTDKTSDREWNWSKTSQIFYYLPQDEPLTLELLIDTIQKKSKPDTRSRKFICFSYARLAKFAGIDGIDLIKNLQGNYSASKVDPRRLPSDEDIVAFRNSVTNEKWQWVVGVMATYGLRNHEVFRLNFSAYPKVYVERGKTGKRLVLPLYPEWAEIWQLWDVKTPDIVNIEEQANNKLGIKVSGWFYNNKAPFSAYNLRHCYARRCFEFGIAPDRAAKLMGHSLAIHLKTYRAWFDEEVYLKEYQRVISDINRPLPPGLT